MTDERDNDALGLGLGCDFPARESFREALLARLLAAREAGPDADRDAGRTTERLAQCTLWSKECPENTENGLFSAI